MKTSKAKQYPNSKPINTPFQRSCSMKRSSIITVLACGSFAFMVGCLNNPNGLNDGREDPSLAISYEEASAEQIAKETAELGQAVAVSANGLVKSAEAASSGAQLSLNGQPWTYAGGWWTRSGEFTINVIQGESLELNGYDSVQFKNAAGSVVQYPIVMNATSAELTHMGHFYIMNRAGGYIDMGRTYTLGAALDRGTDTTLVLNGTLSQYFKAENADKTAWCDYKGNARATDITYNKTADEWSKPVSGSISVESPYRNIDITFSNGIAHVVISDKSGQVKRDFQVTL
jgi:hypothetical protein